MQIMLSGQRYTEFNEIEKNIFSICKLENNGKEEL